MSKDINMKPGFTVFNSMIDEGKFIEVNNYDGINEVCNVSFYFEDSVARDAYSSVGMWKPKNK